MHLNKLEVSEELQEALYSGPVTKFNLVLE